MLMVKPALAYLDVVRAVRERTSPPAGGVQRERRVLDGEGGGAAGLDRRAAGGARGADRACAARARTRSSRITPRTPPRGWRRRRGDDGAGDSAPVTAGVGAAVRGRAAGDARAASTARCARSGASAARPASSRAGEGAWLVDADGNRYVDLVLSWGPLILGHAHPEVLAAVVRGGASAGTTFGAPTELEVRLAERVVATFPSMEMVRFVSSGTEAAMSAVRLARAATGRRGDRQVRRLLSRARRPAPRRRRLGRRHPRAARFARRDCGHRGRHAGRAVQRPRRGGGAVRGARGEQIAAVLVEPVAGNMGVVPPVAGVPPGASRPSPAATARCSSSTR